MQGRNNAHVKTCRENSIRLALCGGIDRLTDLLRLELILMMIPGANRRIDKTAEEKDKADKQYDTGHATVKSMSFSHRGCLTHNGSLDMPCEKGDRDIKSQSGSKVNSSPH